MSDYPRFQETVRRLPSGLYRYLRASGEHLDRIRAILVESKLYFSSPAMFNDPFDCRIPPSYDASPDVIERFWAPTAATEFPNATPEQRQAVLQRMVALHGTPEGQARMREALFTSVNAAGIVSLSSEPSRMPLWSYYADGHAGVAIRLRVTRDNLAKVPGCLPIEVQYSQDLPVVNFYTDDREDFLMTVLGTKSLDWKHEDEWRLVIDDCHGHVPIPHEMVDGVVLGLRTPPQVEATIRGWIAERGEPVELLRIVSRPGSFGLAVESA